MIIETHDDKTVFVLSEKDIKEAVVQYIENLEDTELHTEGEFSFVDDKLHLITQSEKL